MKKRSKLAAASLIFFIVFSPISFPAVIEYSQASSYEEIAEDQEWATDKIIDKDVFIDSEATLTIKKGVTVTFNSKNITVYGKMIVAGTMNSPVIFKKAQGSRNYSISVWQGGSLVARNADVSGGGGFYPWVLQNNSIMNKTYAANGSYQGAFHAGGGILNVQGCNFHDNEVAVSIDNEGAEKVIVNRSKFFNNSLIDVVHTGNDQDYKVDGRYNWWGSSEGPSNSCVEEGDCKIEGAVDSSNWLTSENFHDPVVVIPGIFGSQKEDGIWKIDPIFHVYDNLIDEFKNNGYVVGKDLFIFPYEWRDSNVENAKKLKYKISEIKTIASWPKVDVVAHSMGGLLAREYIESNAYQEDIDQLITLGTPNNGSPEIYPLWEAGKSIGVVQAGMKKFLEQEREEAGYVNIFEYIRKRPIFSASELLPTYEYLVDANNGGPLIYPEDYPANAFLDNLNDVINVKRMTNVEYAKIVGKVASDKSTISFFDVVNVDMGDIWIHGYPLGFEIPVIGDRGITRGYGDGTVPILSAKSIEIPSDNYLELNSSHTDLPTKAQKDVLETLTGVRPTSEVTDSMIKNMLQVFVHSPIDIQIVSPSGLRVGRDFDHPGEFFNEIEGAFYSGAESENEFITIPNPEDGEYRILTQGTGDGEYRVEAVKISNDPNDENEVVESIAIINGIASVDEAEELKVEVVGNVVADKNAKAVTPSDPTVTPPSAPPAAPPVVNQPQTTNIAQASSKKSSHKKSNHKKKKSHNAARKPVKIKAVSKTVKVFGIAIIQKATQNSVAAKSWSYVAQKSSSAWQKTTQAATSLKDLLSKPFKYFKR